MLYTDTWTHGYRPWTQPGRRRPVNEALALPVVTQPLIVLASVGDNSVRMQHWEPDAACRSSSSENRSRDCHSIVNPASKERTDESSGSDWVLIVCGNHNIYNVPVPKYYYCTYLSTSWVDWIRRTGKWSTILHGVENEGSYKHDVMTQEVLFVITAFKSQHASIPGIHRVTVT